MCNTGIYIKLKNNGAVFKFTNGTSVFVKKKGDRYEIKKKKGAENMIEKKTWKEFRDSGLLWFVNTILHLFGWAITVEIEKGKIINVYPVRTKFRGFDMKTNDKGYIKVTEYLKENIDDLIKEVKDDE